MEADVPSCPGWTMTTLVNHVGRVQRWAAAIVETTATERPEFPPRPPEVTPEWFEEGVETLAAALLAADPDTAVWNHVNGPPTVRFWLRRQAAETAVHRWDAENAVGPPSPIETELALAGVDEYLDVFAPNLVRLRAPFDLGGTVHLHATDSDHGEWIISSRDGDILVGHGHEKGDAAARGTASDLLLFLWGRVGADALEVFGDPALLDRLKEALAPG